MKKILIFDLDGTLANPHTSPPRKLYSGAKEALDFFNSKKGDYLLILLTQSNNRKLQEQKITELGLSSCFWLRIVVHTPFDKKISIEEIIVSHHRVDCPQTVIVIGDRPDIEIEFGNLLGCTTVRMRRGKYAYNEPLSEKQKARFETDSFEELVKFIELLPVPA